eukprot:g18492.t1
MFTDRSVHNFDKENTAWHDRHTGRQSLQRTYRKFHLTQLFFKSTEKYFCCAIMKSTSKFALSNHPSKDCLDDCNFYSRHSGRNNTACCLGVQIKAELLADMEDLDEAATPASPPKTDKKEKKDNTVPPKKQQTKPILPTLTRPQPPLTNDSPWLKIVVIMDKYAWPRKWSILTILGFLMMVVNDVLLHRHEAIDHTEHEHRWNPVMKLVHLILSKPVFDAITYFLFSLGLLLLTHVKKDPQFMGLLVGYTWSSTVLFCVGLLHLARGNAFFLSRWWVVSFTACAIAQYMLHEYILSTFLPTLITRARSKKLDDPPLHFDLPSARADLRRLDVTATAVKIFLEPVDPAAPQDDTTAASGGSELVKKYEQLRVQHSELVDKYNAMHWEAEGQEQLKKRIMELETVRDELTFQHENQIKIANDQVATLEARAQSLQSQLKEQLQKQRELQQAQQETKQQTQARNKELANLQDQVNKYKEECAALRVHSENKERVAQQAEEKWTGQSEALKQAQSELAAASGQRNELSSQLAQAQDLMAQARSEAAEATKRYDILLQAVEERRLEWAKKEKEFTSLSQKAKERDRLAAELAEVRENLQSVQQGGSRAASELAALSSLAEQHKQQVAALRSQLEDATAARSQAKQEAKTLYSELQTAKTLYSELQAARNSYEQGSQEASQRGKEIVQLEAELKNLNAQVAKAQTALAKKEAKLQAEKEKVSRLTHELEDLQHVRADVSSQLSVEEEQKIALLARIKTLEQELDEAERASSQQIASLQDEVLAVKREAAANTLALQRVSSESKSVADERIAKLEDEVLQLERRLTQAQLANNQLEQDAETSVEQNQKLMDKLKELAVRAKQAKGLEEAKARLEAEQARLEEKVSSLEKQLTQLQHTKPEGTIKDEGQATSERQEQALNELQKANAKLTREKEQLQQQTTLLTQELQDTQSKWAKEKAKLEEAAKAKLEEAARKRKKDKEKEKDMSAVAVKQEQLLQQCIRLGKEKKQLQEEKTQLEEEKTQLQEQAEELRTRLEQANEEREQLLSQRDAQQNASTNQQDDGTDAREELAEKARQIRRQEKDLAEKDKQVAEKEKQVREQAKELARKGKEVEEKEKQVREQSEELEEKEKQVAEKERQVRQLTEQVASLQSQLDLLPSAADFANVVAEERKQAKEQLERLGRQLEENKQQLDERAEECVQYKQQLEERVEECFAYKQDIEHLETRLRKAQEQDVKKKDKFQKVVEMVKKYQTSLQLCQQKITRLERRLAESVASPIKPSKGGLSSDMEGEEEEGEAATGKEQEQEQEQEQEPAT